jgi:AraC-like DNA-binding protein
MSKVVIRPASPPAPTVPTLVLHAPRERARTFARSLLPRRRVRWQNCGDAASCLAAVRSRMIEAVFVDCSSGADVQWEIAAFARDFPSIPFFAIVAGRAADGPAIAKCIQLEFAEFLVEGVDDDAARGLIEARLFSTRFAAALADAPSALGLVTPLQRDTWQQLIAHGGRAVRTEVLADGVGLSREHLSRRFSEGGAPNLKRVIDLVRLVAAAELAKNPGLDIRDVAAVLGFASSSHLASTSQRILGTRPAALSALRTVDLLERFSQGRGRSRS